MEAPAAPPFALESLEFPRVRALLRPLAATPLGLAWIEAAGPLPSAEEARCALAETGDLAGLLAEGARPPLAGVRECRGWLEGLASGGRLPEARELGDLLGFLKTLDRMRLFFAAHAPERPALGRLGAGLPDLGALRDELERMLDERGEVQDGASARLASLRADLVLAEQGLQAALRRLLQDRTIARCLQSTQVSWRGGRPVLPVKVEHLRRVPGILHDRSQSGQTVFIEPEAVVAATNRLQDLRSQESAEIGRILAELTRLVAVDRHRLLAAHSEVGRVDFVQAKARQVREWGWAVPAIGAGWPLRLREARHPLLWQQCREAGGDPAEIVALDLTLGEAYDSLVVTGPNTGGKTVALKCAGLMAVMALSGLPVPAAEVSVPALDGLFADIGDEQEITQNLSTFSSHALRLGQLFERATRDSLALLDELGAGTDPAEGGPLGYAVLEELLRRGVKVLASTHLGLLKTFALHHPRAENGAMAFDPETLRPLFRLCVGVPGTSNALAIAARAGLPETVLARARRMQERPSQELQSLTSSLQASRLAAEEERRRAEGLHREARQRLASQEAAEQALSNRAAGLEEEAGRRMEAILRQAREGLLDRLKPLHNVPANHRERVLELQGAVERLLAWSPLAQEREGFLARLRRGDTVRVRRFRFVGPVEKVNRARRVVTVLLEGGVRMEVAFEDVAPE